MQFSSSVICPLTFFVASILHLTCEKRIELKDFKSLHNTLMIKHYNPSMTSFFYNPINYPSTLTPLMKTTSVAMSIQVVINLDCTNRCLACPTCNFATNSSKLAKSNTQSAPSQS